MQELVFWALDLHLKLQIRKSWPLLHSFDQTIYLLSSNLFVKYPLWNQHLLYATLKWNCIEYAVLHYLFDSLPLKGVVFTDDAVGHTDELLAELLDVVLAVVGDIGKPGDVSSLWQQLDEGHHVCWLQSLLLGVFQGLDRDVQQGRCLGHAA